MPIMPPLEVPSLGITEDQAQAQFERLQARLVPHWKNISHLNDNPQTIVVVPSQSLEFDCQGAEMQTYEERMLFMLLLLRQPNARMVYVTSQTILPATLDYYVSLLPGVVTRHALDRFENIALEDRSPRPLTQKLLERPHVIERIRSLVVDPASAHLVGFNVTKLERDLALRLGIPIYGADPKFWPLGSKTGSREVFVEAGAKHPIGQNGLGSKEEVLAALNAMRTTRPELGSAMIKLNMGVSGEGNAVVDLSGLPAPDQDGAATALAERVQTMTLEAASTDIDTFLAQIDDIGAIAEERIQGTDLRSPSVQMRVTPLGDVEVLSTHDQLLGGPSGQSFLGSRFPADPAYAALIGREARKIGEVLAKRGVLGRFAVDFVVVQDEAGAWDAYALEINLRKGGTTHPFLILQFLTDGKYLEQEGVFRAPSGQEKHYVSSDHLEDSLYRALTQTELLDILIREGLHFDQARQTGVLVHMLASIAENGRFGVVAVGDTPEEADALYERVQHVVQEAAAAAIAPRPLPPV